MLGPLQRCPPLVGQRAVLAPPVLPRGCAPTAAVLMTILGQEAVAAINNQRGCQGTGWSIKPDLPALRGSFSPRDL